jgi:hypothetical protein
MSKLFLRKIPTLAAWTNAEARASRWPPQPKGKIFVARMMKRFFAGGFLCSIPIAAGDGPRQRAFQFRKIGGLDNKSFRTPGLKIVTKLIVSRINDKRQMAMPG